MDEISVNRTTSEVYLYITIFNWDLGPRLNKELISIATMYKKRWETANLHWLEDFRLICINRNFVSRALTYRVPWGFISCHFLNAQNMRDIISILKKYQIRFHVCGWIIWGYTHGVKDDFLHKCRCLKFHFKTSTVWQTHASFVTYCNG